MVVNQYSYGMCEKVKKFVKILLFELLSEDHILHFLTNCRFYITWNVICQIGQAKAEHTFFQCKHMENEREIRLVLYPMYIYK